MLLTLEQAAEFLQMNAETLRRKFKCGEIPGAKVGRSWLYCLHVTKLPKNQTASRHWRECLICTLQFYPLAILAIEN